MLWLSGIVMMSSSMMSPCGTVTWSAGSFLQPRPVKGLHQDREKGPPNAICMASQQGTFAHFPVSPFRRSIPWRGHNSEVLRWTEHRTTILVVCWSLHHSKNDKALKFRRIDRFGFYLPEVTVLAGQEIWTKFTKSMEALTFGNFMLNYNKVIVFLGFLS